jgi:hypothetical protein
VTGVTVIGVRDHFVAVEAHVVRGQREAMPLSLKATSTAQLAGLPIDLRTKRYSPGC